MPLFRHQIWMLVLATALGVSGCMLEGPQGFAESEDQADFDETVRIDALRVAEGDKRDKGDRSARSDHARGGHPPHACGDRPSRARHGHGRPAHHGPRGERGHHGPRAERGHHGPRGHRRAHMPPRELLNWLYDLDGSGHLDDAERAMLRADLQTRCENRRAARLARFDADADGRLDRGERRAMHEARRARHEARHARMLAEYDFNGNGRVDRDERQQHRSDRRARLHRDFDADESGDLDGAEMASLREFMMARVRGEHFRWE